jgi:predicted alpha-1,2-mannosidase
MKYFNFKLFALLLAVSITSGSSIAQKKNIDFVNPFIGTGGHGHTFPGATTPFGMVQLSPDTRMEGWDGCGGYHYDDSYVYGFAHTHLSGTGCEDLSDILFMPVTGKPSLEYKEGKPAFGSKFSHKNESAKPGYYQVFLDDYKTKVELTAAPRSGFHQYQFPKDQKTVSIIIDLKYRDEVIETKLTKVNDTEVEGYRISRGWAAKQYVYFAAKFSKPIKEIIKTNEGKGDIASLLFSNTGSQTIKVKVGISQVDIKGARKNMQKEIPGWDFNKVVKDNQALWNKYLNRIEVSGGTTDQKTIFYTALYHAMVTPNICQDVDGRYRALDLKVYKTGGRNQYTTLSLWDTYRAAHPLYTILVPELIDGLVKSMLDDFQKGGNLPVWTLYANDTWCMIGNHSIPVIVDAYMKKLTTVNVNEMLKAMDVSVNKERQGYKQYNDSGVMLTGFTDQSVSKNLEYAYDDWCIAQFAKMAGNNDMYSHYLQRAQSYKNLFDETTKFFRAKADYSFITPFDPFEISGHYTEANAWQYRYYVPQDIEGWKKFIGGSNGLEKMLDDLFTAEAKTTGSELSDMTGFIGQYVHGNEPSHHMAYLYNYTGNSWKNQPLLNKIMGEMYSANPNGLEGNEDCGQMSAWYILSAMGFYPVNPAGGIYDLGLPLFKSVKIHSKGNKTFTITADRKNEKAIYVNSLKLNGKPYSNNYLLHSDIIKGGTFAVGLQETPDKDFSAKLAAPVYSITEDVITPIPYITPASRRFSESINVELKNPDKDAVIYYTLDGTEPTVKSFVYEQPIPVSSTTTLKAFAVSKGLLTSKVISAVFDKMTLLPSVKLNTPLRPGVNYSYFEGNWSKIPDFTKLTPVKSGEQANIDLTSKNRDEYFAMEFNGWINIPEDGLYLFSIGSDDGGILLIDNKEKIDNDKMHSYAKKDREMLLAKGYHSIKVSFVQGSSDAELKLFWKGPGFELQPVPSNILFR